MDSGDEGADGGNARPQNFWARAPLLTALLLIMILSVRVRINGKLQNKRVMLTKSRESARPVIQEAEVTKCKLPTRPLWQQLYQPEVEPMRCVSDITQGPSVQQRI